MGAEPFLSLSWYKVAALRPKLREHGELHRHRYRGEIVYLLYDHAKSQAHKLSAASHRLVAAMDGKRSIDELWQETARHLGPEAPSQDEMVRFLAQLHAADLLQSDISPDLFELLERHDRQQKSVLKQRLLSPLSIRIPLWDPDRFLDRTARWACWPFSWIGALLWAAVVIPALALAVQSWADLTADISTRVLAAENLLLIALTYPVIKALHEFGHAYAVKAFGGVVHEMGIMFLVLFPLPYVDASASYRFRSKYRRIVVGAAGILVEIFMAAIAVYVWLLVEPGLIRAIAFNAIVVAGISTLLFNGNPLLKYDGYYILTDLIEIPNLALRAARYWNYLFNRYLFASAHVEEFKAAKGERIWLLCYAPASFIYRQVIMLGIALYVATKYLVVGALLAAWTLFSAVVVPIFKACRYLFTGPQLAGSRTRSISVAGTATAAIAVLLFAVPIPHYTASEGVVWLPENAIVRAGTDGFIKRLLVPSGTQVTAGTALVESEEPVLGAQLGVDRARVAELEAQHAAEFFTDQVKAAVTAAELAHARAALANVGERMQNLVITGRSNGTFYLLHPEDLPGRFLHEGQPLGYVLPAGSRIVRVTVTQDDIDLVRNHLRGASIRLAERIGEVWPVRIVREVPQGRDELPSKALGGQGGGSFATDPGDRSGLRTLQRVFQFDLQLPDDARLPAAFGAHVHVRFEHDWEPLGWQIWRRARQLFLSRLQF